MNRANNKDLSLCAISELPSNIITMILAEYTSRAPDRSDRNLGPAGVARYILHPPHLRLLRVLRCHVQVKLFPKNELRTVDKRHLYFGLNLVIKACHY